VPVFNSAKYLSNCVDSIRSQTFKDFECILVDDGSTDDTLALCKKYSELDSRIKVLRQNNSGVSSARNLGLRRSTGEYIAFVDSDDTVLPEMYYVMLDAMLKYNSDVVCCGYLHKGRAYSLPNFFYTENQAKGAYELEKAELFGLIWNKIYKKNILNGNNIFFLPGQSFGEDMLFNLKYFSIVNTILNIPNILYDYSETNVYSISKKRPSFEQSYLRFTNVSKEIVRLKGAAAYINFLLAADFSYTVFLIRNLYTPVLSPDGKRREIISEIKYFYDKNNAKGSFRGGKYRILYHFLEKFPFFMADRVFMFIFTILFKIRGYS
jgi:glycosyltransferase involved in cell wall biosynthesis